MGVSIPGIFFIRANLASPKTLVWSNMSFLDQGTRVTIYLTVPKASIGGHGHAIFLNCNPVAYFCPVTFLPKVKKSYPDQGPVFRLKLGKFLTPSLVNKILSEVGTLANLTPSTPYSCHSLCDISTSSRLIWVIYPTRAFGPREIYFIFHSSTNLAVWYNIISP